jgi:hybrid cluster-associated redox disulfide protein
MEQKITKDMLIEDVIKKYPETAIVFSRYNIGCVGCFAASSETIEDIARVHGTDIKKFLKELNEVIEDR